MTRKRICWLAIAVALGLTVSSAFGQRKLAQTGFQFLSVGTDARAVAMGEAYTTVEGSSSSLFYNPANMALVQSKFEFAANRMNWIADIEYFSGSLAYQPGDGDFGVIGFSFMAIDYGDFIGTIVSGNEQGFEETGTISPTSLVVGLGYAKRLNAQFSVGGQAKLVHQNLGDLVVPASDTTSETIDFSVGVVAFDFGTIYHTAFKSLKFGMNVRNFSQEIKYQDDLDSFELPLTFRIGFSIDALDFWPGGRPQSQKMLIAVDATNPRSFDEFISVGGEYRLADILAIRGGYAFAQDDYGASYGFGVQSFGVAIDYSYTPFDIFDGVNRFSVRFSF